MMNLNLLDIETAGITVNPDDIVSLLGGPQGNEFDLHQDELIQKYISEILNLLTPRGGYARGKATEVDSAGEIAIEGSRFKTGNIIRKKLHGSTAYAMFMVTIGPQPENLARKLMEKGDYLDGYLVDILASAMVDSAANQVQEQIQRRAAKQRLLITNRYSPGYCNWDVAEQQKLFKLFPDNFCGITLSKSSLMSPIKSISGIIGIGSSVKYQEYTCEICSMTHCQFRSPKGHRPE